MPIFTFERTYSGIGEAVYRIQVDAENLEDAKGLLEANDIESEELVSTDLSDNGANYSDTHIPT